jgi:hypothetical protein
MDERIIKWKICIFIILFVLSIPSLLEAKTAEELLEMCRHLSSTVK